MLHQFSILISQKNPHLCVDIQSYFLELTSGSININHYFYTWLSEIIYKRSGVTVRCTDLTLNGLTCRWHCSLSQPCTSHGNSSMHSSAVCDGLWTTAASDRDRQDEEGA